MSQAAVLSAAAVHRRVARLTAGLLSGKGVPALGGQWSAGWSWTLADGFRSAARNADR